MKLTAPPQLPVLPKRLFLESDHLTDLDLSTAKSDVHHYLKSSGMATKPGVFDEVISYAWHDLPKTWEAIKRNDEIFAASSLYGLTGKYCYVGSPVLMNEMMARAKAQKIAGKSLYFTTPSKEIVWENCRPGLLRFVFLKRNSLYVTDEETHAFVKVDILEILKELRENK